MFQLKGEIGKSQINGAIQQFEVIRNTLDSGIAACLQEQEKHQAVIDKAYEQKADLEAHITKARRFHEKISKLIE